MFPLILKLYVLDAGIRNVMLITNVIFNLFGMRISGIGILSLKRKLKLNGLGRGS